MVDRRRDEDREIEKKNEDRQRQDRGPRNDDDGNFVSFDRPPPERPKK